MKREQGEPVERPMQNYEDSHLTQVHVDAITRTIERHVKSKPAGAFLKGLLTLTIDHGVEWYTRKQIAGVVGVDPERSASNLWVKNQDLFEQFETHRNRLSEALGGKLLTLQLREGNPNLYRLELVDASMEPVPFRLEGSVLRYRLSDDAPRLSLIGKAHHPGVGTGRDQYQKWLFLTPFFAALVFAALCMLMLALTAALPFWGAPFVISNYVSVGLFGALVIYGIWRRWGRLLDDRVLLLATNDLAAGEEGVILERERFEEKNFMVLRRYVAPCPICHSATVRLSRGEPDFKRRIVGRCEESPREHVYSFDRVTLEGGPLIQRLALKSYVDG